MANVDWDLFQSLHAVMQTGSLSGAAKIRGLTQPTLGRHIEALEQKLGASLFLRSPRGLTPTDLAHAIAPHLDEMSAAAAAALRDASGSADSMEGAIRITSSQIMGAEILPAILADFQREHSAVEIELALSNKAEDLSRRDADIAVRMMRPTQGALIAKKVGTITVAFYATQAYVDAHGAPQTLEELTGHTIVGFDREAPPLQALADLDLPWEINRDLFAFRSDNDLAQMAAVRAGVGIGAFQRQIARRDGLVPILANAFGFELEVWIAMHENLKTNKRMRMMFDHLVTRLTAFVAEGRR